MQPQFIPLQMEEVQVKKSKVGNLIMTASFIFLVIMLFFSTISYSSVYNHDQIVFNTYMQSTHANNKDVAAIKQYYFHQHEADYVFGLLLFILVLSSFGLWMLVFLNSAKRNAFNSRLSHFLLFFINLIICACCIVCFIYYMCYGESQYDQLERIQGQIPGWKKTIEEDASASKSAFEYMIGYIDSIVDIIRPFVIINFIVAIVYIVVSFALVGMQASKERKAFRPL